MSLKEDFTDNLDARKDLHVGWICNQILYVYNIFKV